MARVRGQKKKPKRRQAKAVPSTPAPRRRRKPAPHPGTGTALVPAPLSSLAHPEPNLTPAQRAFCEAYLENGFNGTEAYQTAYPTVTRESAATLAWKSLRKVEIRDYLRPRMDATWKALQISGDEALARVGIAATLDIRKLYQDGRLMDPSLWPEEFVGCVKSIQDGPYGLKVTLVDPLTAQRIILEQSGKLKSAGDSLDALADAIRQDFERTKAHHAAQE